MSRWLIELSGDRMDLEEFPRWFPNGEIFAIEEKGQIFLTGSGFDHKTSVEAVRKAAIDALDRFWAVISLLWSSARKPTISSVSQETDDGGRSMYVLVSGVTLRAKTTGTLTQGDTPATPGPTQAQELLSIARQSPNLDTALWVWAHPYRSWPQLYRILEEIEKYLKQPISKAGLSSDNNRERFKRTANSAEAVGVDARHAIGESEQPENPMSLEEGTSFVAEILEKVLRKATKGG